MLAASDASSSNQDVMEALAEEPLPIPVAQVLTSSTRSQINNNSNNANSITNGLLSQYDPCKCGKGCINRAALCPLSLAASAFVCACNPFVLIFECKLAYVPFCVSDFIVVDKLHPYCCLASYPLSLTAPDFKVILKSNAMKSFDLFDLSLFKNESEQDFINAMRFASSEFNTKATKIQEIRGRSCNINNNVAKSLFGLIHSLPQVNNIDLSYNRISDRGFLDIIDALVCKPRPLKLAPVMLPLLSVENAFPNGMVNVFLDGNAQISVDAVVVACQQLEGVDYPLMISLTYIFRSSDQRMKNAVINLYQRNSNVMIFTSDVEFKALYTDLRSQTQQIDRTRPVIAIPVSMEDMTRSSSSSPSSSTSAANQQQLMNS